MLIYLCALHCEAKPVIDLYRLKKDHSTNAFDTYRNDDVTCIVSGIGELNMATACGWAAATITSRPRSWINLGVAGHQDLEVGATVLALKIGHEREPRCHYPVPLVRHDFVTGEVISQTRERQDYHATALYDMEAWAFVHAISRFDNLEACQCIKVVSDNASSTLNRDKAFISQLIAASMPAIDRHVQQTATLINSGRELTDVDTQMNRFMALTHFTESERIQLRKLLPLLVREADMENLFRSCQGLQRSSDIIKRLGGELHRNAVRL